VRVTVYVDWFPTATRNDYDAIVEWPELSVDGRPLLPAAIADRVDQIARLTTTRSIAIVTCSEVVIYRLCRRVAEGWALDVQVRFRNHAPITVNQHGHLSNWPKGVFDMTALDICAIADVRIASLTPGRP
jgi:hypothetical protein